jgi:hypothetical protein
MRPRTQPVMRRAVKNRGRTEDYTNCTRSIYRFRARLSR